ncbi:glycosyltransferase family 2 protein [Verrucomicrobiota bacterium sgz303538]
MTPPVFSIVTPSFNSASWLRLCIASVADQEGVTLEHIVQDGGSTDGTPEWLTSDPRVHAFVEKDSGMYDAINRGLARAQGEICAYLNCDEQYLGGTLRRVKDFFDQHPQVMIIFGDALLINEEAQLLSYRRAVLPSRLHTKYVHLNTLSCAMFFRRTVFEAGYRFDSQWRAIGDAVWVHRLIEARIPMAVLPEPLAAFAFTGENLSTTNRAEEEAQRWSNGDWLKRGAPVFSLLHRIQKWRAGAYQKRTIHTELYSRTSMEKRQSFKADALGFYWPNQQPSKACS